MTLRLRMAAVAGLAVAVTALALAVAVYVAVRSELIGEIDSSLVARAQPFVMPSSPVGPGAGGGSAAGAPAAGSGPSRGAGFGAGARAAAAPGHGGAFGPRGGPGGGGFAGAGAGAGGRGAAGGGGGPVAGQPPAPQDYLATPTQPFGGASGQLQIVSPNGTREALAGSSPSSRIPIDASTRAIAASGSGKALTDETADGIHIRVLTEGAGSLGAVQVARPLTEVDHDLSRVLLILIVAGAAAVAVAIVLGGVVARTALAPIARFARRTEQLTAEPDTSARLEVSGRDELARLARSFNGTLDALERSITAQRHLVADASHELRTPIASLRANIQVLEDEDRLPLAERQALHADIISELDELTALVGDVVELARGGKPGQALDDVRLDEVVSSALARTQRRAEGLRFDVHLEPTLVTGEADRINRAVSNILENARKYSPPGASVEVGLSEGVLSVRDHGPGFREEDLPHVFDRFYRAQSARQLPGSGLGLAIAKQAAEAHGGFVRATNATGGGALLQIGFGAAVRPATEGLDGFSSFVRLP